MEQYMKYFFQIFESMGLHQEFVILSMIGIVVTWLLWKQSRLFRAYHKTLVTFLAKQDQKVDGLEGHWKKFDLEEVKDKIDGLGNNWVRFNAQCSDCAKHRVELDKEYAVWRESVNEKFDQVEDNLKEIKKTLLFK
jgi:hypothetical protein